jgi:hypothetical protein
MIQNLTIHETKNDSTTIPHMQLDLSGFHLFSNDKIVNSHRKLLTHFLCSYKLVSLSSECKGKYIIILGKIPFEEHDLRLCHYF